VQESGTALNLPSLDQVRGLDPVTLIGRLRLGIETFDPRVFDLSHSDLDRAWLPDAGVGRWSCRALLAHLMDCELVYSYRIRRVLAEDGPVFENFDEDAFVDSPLYGMRGRDPADTRGDTAVRTPPGAMAAAIHTLRQMTGAVLYQLDPAEWERTGMHPTEGPMTLRELVSLHTWHLEHHAAFMNAKIERMLGPRPPEEACAEAGQPGGCGAGCACAAAGDAQGTE
jgi:hypothetical protein